VEFITDKVDQRETMKMQREYNYKREGKPEKRNRLEDKKNVKDYHKKRKIIKINPNKMHHFVSIARLSKQRVRKM